jgi:hypothetical protein
MPQPRRYTDDQLRAAVAESTNWTQVMLALGKSPGASNKGVVTTAERLGLDTSHFAYKQSFRPVPAVKAPFNNEVRHAGQSGLSIAARWFLDRGYIVSVPLEPAPYDLIAESDDGLKRVQVKSTTQIQSNGRYAAGVSRNVHSSGQRRNANGSRKRVPYSPGSIDYFFIVTPAAAYLIPIEVVGGRTQIVLDAKYAAFAVKPS